MQAFRRNMKDQTMLYTFVAVLFLVGVVFGALMVNALSLEQQQELGNYLGNYFIEVDQGAGMIGQDVYWNIAGQHLKWIGLIWILGLSVVGLPGILVLDFLKGVLIGFTVGYLVGHFSWKGFLFALVSVAPHNLMIIPVLLICSVGAVSFSIYVIKQRIFSKRHDDLSRPFFKYCALFLVMGFIVLGIASFETWITPAMMRWVTPMLVQL